MVLKCVDLWSMFSNWENSGCVLSMSGPSIEGDIWAADIAQHVF